MLFHGLMFYFWIIRMNPCFFSCQYAVKKFLTYILVGWKKTIAGNFQFLKLSTLPSAFKEPSSTNLPLFKSINNVTHMLLWNAQLDRKFLLGDLSIVQYQFNISHVKLVSCHKSFTSFLIIPISSSQFIFTFLRPAMHSIRVYTVITKTNPHLSINFKKGNSCGNQNFNYGTLLKVH